MQSKLAIDVDVLGSVVRQRVTLVDWSFKTSRPVDGRDEFHLRLARPDNSVLAALLDRLLDRRNSDPVARRKLGLHVLGIYLNPEALLPKLYLTRQNITRSGLVVGSGGGPTARFEAWVTSHMPAQDEPFDLGDEATRALIDVTPDKARELYPRGCNFEDDLIEEAIGQHSAVVRRLSSAGGDFRRLPPSPAKSKEAHRVRQWLLRRIGNDPAVLRLLALKYVCDGDALVDEANRLTFAALAPHLSEPERRAFEFFRLKPGPGEGVLAGANGGFDGIIGYQPYLMSLFERSDRTFMALAFARFFRVWAIEDADDAEADLRRRLVGLLRAGTYVLSALRNAEAIKVASRRDARRYPMGRSEAEDDDSATREDASGEASRRLRKALQVLTPAQRRVMELRADGLTNAQIAGELGVTYQAVQNTYRRALERIRRRSTR